MRKTLELFQNLLSQNNLTDLWRLTHEQDKEYTWSKKSPNFIARRLDYIIVADNLIEKCHECELTSTAQSDHRLIHMKYRLSSTPRGPSYWKFNDSLIYDANFVEQMNNLIASVETNHITLEPQDKWDLCKIKIKEFSISYCKQKNFQKRNRLSNINRQLDEIEKKLAQNPNNANLLKEKNKLKNELEIFEMNNAKSAQIR